MKFQCVLCLSTYNVDNMQFGASIDCPSCGKKIAVPRKSFDRGRLIGGDFVIDRIFCTGAMGTVYLARQISLARDVALKVLARKYSVDPKFRMEFQREARAASRLTHTNLVQAYAFGEDEGDLYLAMEYVEGVTLGDRLDNETRLTLDEALNICQQVAEGLDFAWTQEQLIHRDIKPDNIMLTADGHVKLTDMGLARTAVELENVTEVSGTPAYMNPEQFTKKPMDSRADIYSLGVCLYHAVTGDLPFDSPNVRELARQHLQDPLEFPDKTVDLPSEIKKLLRKMMEKNRESRFDDHEALLHKIYDVRVKLSSSSIHVPSVHTLSFNRYEFKDLAPERRGGSNKPSTNVSSTKHLRRRKIAPLSSVTTRISNSFVSSEGSGKSNFITYNLVAVIAVISAVTLALIYGGDKESHFYKQVQALVIKVKANSFTTQQVLDKVDNLLAQEMISEMNKKDYYARNVLFETKLRYMKTLLEEKSEAMRFYQADMEILKKNNRRLSAGKTIKEEKYKYQIDELNSLLDQARQKAISDKDKLEDQELTASLSPSFAQVIIEDMSTLGTLWEMRQNSYRLEILRDMSVGSFTQARKVILKNSSLYEGKYQQWLKEQYAFVGNARAVRDFLKANLSAIQDERLEVSGEVVRIAEVFPSSMLVMTYEGFELDLGNLSGKDSLSLYKKVCELSSTPPIDAVPFIISKLDFNYALELDFINDKVSEYALVYVKERLSYAEKLIAKGEVAKAESLMLQVYSKCDKIEALGDLKAKIIDIFGEDIFEQED